MTKPRRRRLSKVHRRFLCRFLCRDCGIDTNEIGEYYMVRDKVWGAAAGIPPNGGMLCVACLERRLGRQLTRDDFPDTA